MLLNKTGEVRIILKKMVSLVVCMKDVVSNCLSM
jgi:hypothetical protein